MRLAWIIIEVWENKTRVPYIILEPPFYFGQSYSPNKRENVLKFHENSLIYRYRISGVESFFEIYLRFKLATALAISQEFIFPLFIWKSRQGEKRHVTSQPPWIQITLLHFIKLAYNTPKFKVSSVQSPRTRTCWSSLSKGQAWVKCCSFRKMLYAKFSVREHAFSHFAGELSRLRPRLIWLLGSSFPKSLKIFYDAYLNSLESYNCSSQLKTFETFFDKNENLFRRNLEAKFPQDRLTKHLFGHSIEVEFRGKL